MQGVKLRINETGLNCIPIAKRTDTSVVIREFLSIFLPKKRPAFLQALVLFGSPSRTRTNDAGQVSRLRRALEAKLGAAS